MTPDVLRPATPADSEFCYQLHKAAMRSYVTAIWGWDEHVQREHHARAFNPSRWQIITVGGTAIGMLDIEHRPDEIYLARVEIHPDHQGHGIGTRLVSALLDEARQNGKALVLDVLAVNHRAVRPAERVTLPNTGPADHDSRRCQRCPAVIRDTPQAERQTACRR